MNQQVCHFAVNSHRKKRETCKIPVARAACRALLCPDALIGGLMTYLKCQRIVML